MGPKMQEQMEQLKSIQVCGVSGGGMVKVHANGGGQILSVEIDAVLEEKNDFEMVKDLLPAAINDALEKQQQLRMEAMQSVTEDLPLPGNNSFELLRGLTLGATDVIRVRSDIGGVSFGLSGSIVS